VIQMSEHEHERQVPGAAPELIEELLIVALDSAYRLRCSPNVGAASAVLAGITLLLRQAEPGEVSAWLKCLAAEIETTGQPPPLGNLPTYRLKVVKSSAAQP
jgi:hypothetical protein